MNTKCANQVCEKQQEAAAPIWVRHPNKLGRYKYLEFAMCPHCASKITDKTDPLHWPTVRVDCMLREINTDPNLSKEK